jgi:chromosome segregation ATPase
LEQKNSQALVLEEKLQQAVQDINTIRSKAMSTVYALSLYQRKISDLVEKIRQMTDIQVDLDSRISRSTANVQSMESLIESQRKTIDGFEGNRVKLQNTVDKQRLEIEGLQDANRELVKKNKELTESVMSQEYKCKKLEDTCASYSLKLSESTNIMSDKDKRCVELENRLFETLSQQVKQIQQTPIYITTSNHDTNSTNNINSDQAKPDPKKSNAMNKEKNSDALRRSVDTEVSLLSRGSLDSGNAHTSVPTNNKNNKSLKKSEPKISLVKKKSTNNSGSVGSGPTRAKKGKGNRLALEIGVKGAYNVTELFNTLDQIDSDAVGL